MIFLFALTIETDTLWVQPTDPRIYGDDQVTGGALIAWTPDLALDGHYDRG
ncbi:MAG: hypothetical protein ACP5QG_06040 [candidate division WOR-3 bacterium]